MAGRIVAQHNLLNNYHQIHFSSKNKQIAGFICDYRIYCSSANVGQTHDIQVHWHVLVSNGGHLELVL